MSAREPFRRRVRAGALGLLASGAGVVPEAWMRTALERLAERMRHGRHGRLAVENLRACAPSLYPDLAADHSTGRAASAEHGSSARLEALSRAVFRHDARLFAEWLRLANGAAPDSPRGAWIDARVALGASVDRLRDALAEGRGAIVVTAHLGNWELLAAALRRAGLHGSVVGFRRRRDSSSAWIERMRASYGVRTIPHDASPRELLRVLRGGEVLGLLADLEARRLDGRFLPFLGRPAWTMTAPAALARSSGLPLWPVRCTLNAEAGPERYALEVEDPLHFDTALEREAATLDLCSRMNAVFERWIRRWPEQWAWHQARWRLQPEAPGDAPATGRAESAAERAARGLPTPGASVRPTPFADRTPPSRAHPPHSEEAR